MIRKLLNNILGLRRNLVIQNLALVTGISILIKGLSFYKETIVASVFGLSEILDTYFLALVVPNLINKIFLGPFAKTFIPNYIAESKAGNRVDTFQGTAILITAVTSLFFVIITYLTTDLFLEALFPGHDAGYYENVRIQLYFILPSIVFWGFIALLTGLLNINKEFKHATLSGMFMPIVLIVFLLFFREFIGKYVLAIGTLVGAFLGFVYVAVVSYHRGIINIGKPDFSNPNVKIMLRQVPAKIISSVLAAMHGVIAVYFAAQLIIGSVAALNYGARVTTVILSLLVIGVSNVLLPHFSTMVITNRPKSFSNLFKMARICFFTVAIIAVVGIFASEFIIEILFERGEFTAEDTAVVSKLQQITLLYLPFKVCEALFVNFLTSLNQNNYLAYVSFFSVVIDIILIVSLIDTYGVFGIAAATTTAIILRSILMYVFIVKQSKKS